MEYSRARGKLPAGLEGLLASQITYAIDEANLGLADKRMVMRYYVDHLPQIDIAVEMGLSRQTVNKRLKDAGSKVSRAAAKFNIPQ